VVCAAVSSDVDVRDMSADAPDRDSNEPLMLRPKKPISWLISSWRIFEPARSAACNLSS
jgi:hypothetical protein